MNNPIILDEIDSEVVLYAKSHFIRTSQQDDLKKLAAKWACLDLQYVGINTILHMLFQTCRKAGVSRLDDGKVIDWLLARDNIPMFRKEPHEAAIEWLLGEIGHVQVKNGDERLIVFTVKEPTALPWSNLESSYKMLDLPIPESLLQPAEME